MSHDPAPRPLRVLLAEDDVVNQQVAVALLRKRGHEVDAVSNGSEAVEAVQAKRYDVVLMDIQMPVMGGREATRRIRALPGFSELPVVALTGQDLPDERKQCEEAGMSDFLSKPFEPHELYHVVERWTGAVAPPVDVEAFRAMLREGGIEEIADSTLQMYQEESEPTFEALRQAVEVGDTEGIESKAHALKSSSSTIRADRFAELLRELERLARDGDTAGAADVFPGVAREFRAVMDYLADQGE